MKYIVIIKKIIIFLFSKADVSSYETNIDPFFEHIETTTQINKAELIDFLRDKKSTNISEVS